MHILTVNFPKGKTVNDDPKIIKESEGYYHGPIVTQPPCWIKDEGPIRSFPQTGVVGINPPQSVTTENKIKICRFHRFNTVCV